MLTGSKFLILLIDIIYKRKSNFCWLPSFFFMLYKKMHTILLLSQKYGQPIVDRYKEASERPKAFEALGSAIQKVQKAVDLYHAKVSNWTNEE